jgi:hypothetical protein
MPVNPIVMWRYSNLQITNRYTNEQKQHIYIVKNINQYKNIDISKYNNKFFEKVILLC